MDIGMENIRANVNAPDGRILKENIEVPIKDLHSPLSALEPEKYQKNLEKMIKSPDEMPPTEVMPVTIPRHLSIMDVH
ncbi:MAG: hypothetical protein LBN22_08345 [Clostridiales Family XIII bacterium]|nr:hypothetical protein [Clostridiales Family XIII bacterium]